MRLTEEEYQDLIKRRAGQIRDMAHQLNFPVPRNAEKLAEDTIPLSICPVKMVKPREVPNRFECPAPAPPTEEQEQRTVAQFLDLFFPGEWFHVPNGGMRNKAEGGKLKAQGVKPGVPDNFIFRPVCNAPGVVIELKRISGGTVSKEQKEWLKMLSKFGWLCYCIKGADAAIKLLQYLYFNKGDKPCGKSISQVTGLEDC